MDNIAYVTLFLFSCITEFLNCFFIQFGESQKLRLVRILRSTVMVRVGGGWVSLDEFLLKNDPCRGKFIVIFMNQHRPSFIYLCFVSLCFLFCIFCYHFRNVKITDARMFEKLACFHVQ